MKWKEFESKKFKEVVLKGEAALRGNSNGDD